VPIGPSAGLCLDELNAQDPQRRVGIGDLPIVAVLGDDREAVLDSGSGDQGVGELDGTMDTRRPTVGDERAQVTMTASLIGIGSAALARARVSALARR
jgi:hypothetical protein